MAHAPLRFLVAAGLAPGAALAGVPARFAGLATDASRLAVDRLVSHAAKEQVDFVLGFAADDGDRLESQAAADLEAALGGLAEAGIDLVLVSRRNGSARPPAGSPWVTPENRSVTLPLSGRPPVVVRLLDGPDPNDGPRRPTLISGSALIGAAFDAPADAAAVALRQQGYRFVAVAGGTDRPAGAAGVAVRSVGAVQGRSPAETGPHGANLVTLGDRADVRFLPTAAVRFETVPLPIDDEEAIDDVAVRMADALAALRPEPGEEAWCVRWSLTASGRAFDALASRAVQTDLAELLPADLGGVPVAHEFRVEPHPRWQSARDPFGAEFAAAFASAEAAAWAGTARLDLLGPAARGPHRARLERLLAGVDPAAVRARAHALGRRITEAIDRDEEPAAGPARSVRAKIG